jgi:hypothetical protein
MFGTALVCASCLARQQCKLNMLFRQKQRNSEGVYNKHGGNNKILNDAQEEAIRQYCYEQWEMGLGTSHKMVFSAISYLKKVRYY